MDTCPPQIDAAASRALLVLREQQRHLLSGQIQFDDLTLMPHQNNEIARNDKFYPNTFLRSLCERALQYRKKGCSASLRLGFVQVARRKTQIRSSGDRKLKRSHLRNRARRTAGKSSVQRISKPNPPEPTPAT